MPQQGRLVDWNDARGFGFIRAEDGERVFVHISAIRSPSRRPEIGDTMRFVPGFSSSGRIEAKSVQIVGAAADPAAPRPTLSLAHPDFGWRLPAILAIVALLATAIVLGRLPIAIAAIYAVMSVVSFVLYDMDKRAAAAGQWRVSEATLLGMDFFFGLPGGLLGQACFRHKTRKRSYIAATALILLMHLAWLTAMATGLLTLENVVEAVTSLSLSGG